MAYVPQWVLDKQAKEKPAKKAPKKKAKPVEEAPVVDTVPEVPLVAPTEAEPTV